jgi:hypothetical protein
MAGAVEHVTRGLAVELAVGLSRTTSLVMAGLFLLASFVALVMTRWLPVASLAEQEAIASSSESAVAALANGHGPQLDAAVQAETNGKHGGLERIATLLEEIEARRDREARRTFRS